MSKYDEIKQLTYKANMQLPELGLVLLHLEMQAPLIEMKALLQLSPAEFLIQNLLLIKW